MMAHLIHARSVQHCHYWSRCCRKLHSAGVAERSRATIVVLDVDLEGTYSTSELNPRGMRANWTREVNQLLARESLAYYERLKEQVGFAQKGYLWLIPPEKWKEQRAITRKWARAGFVVNELSEEEVAKRIPEFTDRSGIGGAVEFPKDGLIQASLLKQYYRSAARQRGAVFVDRGFVTSVSVQNGKWLVTAKLLAMGDVRQGDEALERALTRNECEAKLPVVQVEAETLVNAAGAWAPIISHGCGVKNLAAPVRRQLCMFHSRDADLKRQGMIVDVNGVFYYPEGGNVAVGFIGNGAAATTACPAVPPPMPIEIGYNFRFEGLDVFKQQVFPRLAKRCAAFEKSKHMGGWTLMQSTTPDGTGVLWEVKDAKAHLIEAYGFGPRDVTQSYAVGIAAADIVLTGKSERYDVSALHPKRFEDPKLFETEELNI